MAESFVDLYKTELIADRVWRTRSQLELATVEWVAGITTSGCTRRWATSRRSSSKRPTRPGPRSGGPPPLQAPTACHRCWPSSTPGLTTPGGVTHQSTDGHAFFAVIGAVALGSQARVREAGHGPAALGRGHAMK